MNLATEWIALRRRTEAAIAVSRLAIAASRRTRTETRIILDGLTAFRAPSPRP